MSENLKDYLNAKTSITFGASAAMVVAFTATLCSAFPFLPSAIVAISLSGILAAVQVANAKDKLIVKGLFWFLCMMVIFHAARGGNTTLREAAGEQGTPTEIVVPESHASASLLDFIVPSAYAGGTNDVQPNKYYLWKIDFDGKAVYTNAAGRSYTNTTRRAFDKWDWKN